MRVFDCYYATTQHCNTLAIAIVLVLEFTFKNTRQLFLFGLQQLLYTASHLKNENLQYDAIAA